MHCAFCWRKCFHILLLEVSRLIIGIYQGLILNGMKEHVLSYDIGPDDTYFQYTTVSHNLPHSKVLDNDTNCFEARMDDVEFDRTRVVPRSTSHRI